MISVSQPAPQLPAPPSPPANPPMFSSSPNKAGQAVGAQVNQGGFASTVLGQTNPSNTGMKTLLGQ